MKRSTIHATMMTLLSIAAAALIAASAFGLAPPPAGSAPVPAAGTGWKEMQLRYPDADAVVLYDSLVVTLDGADRVSRRYHRAVMLFTDNAINRYGDPRLLFNAATQDLAILAARVRMRDGTIVDAQKNAFNQTTPFSLDLTPDYADWQETVVTLMGVEKGCVAELHYTIADKSASPWLSGVEVFSAEDPTQERVLAVRLPAGRSLKFASLRGEAPPPDTDAAGAWDWTVRNIPGRTPLDGGVWSGDYFPAVCYSTAADWKSVLSRLGERLATASPAAPAAEASIRDAVKDCGPTLEARAVAVHRLAIGAVRGIRAPYPLCAAPARDAARIYDTGYASPLDGAVLLASMLRTLEFEPAFVLVSSGTTAVGETPAPELFSRVAVSVPIGNEGELLLDPATPLERDPSFSLAGRTLARLGPAPRLERFPARNSSESGSGLVIDLVPGKDGALEGEGTAILKGAFSPYYLVREGETGLADYLKKRVSGLFGGAKLVSWNPRAVDRDRIEVDFTFTMELPDKKKGERVYLAMPRPFDSPLSGIERVQLWRSQIEDPIRLEPSELDVRCTIELPEGWKRVTDSFSVSETNRLGSVSADAAETAGDAMEFRSRLVLPGGLVPPESFGEFKALLRAYGQDRIVLEKD